MTTFLEPACTKCRHWRPDWSCKSFPRGIPEEIWEQGKHDTPIKGQRNGIVFEADRNEMTSFMIPICVDCEHYNVDDESKLSCKAFPRGISHEIFATGKHDKPRTSMIKIT